jgi:hypothetical protein
MHLIKKKKPTLEEYKKIVATRYNPYKIYQEYKRLKYELDCFQYKLKDAQEVTYARITYNHENRSDEDFWRYLEKRLVSATEDLEKIESKIQDTYSIYKHLCDIIGIPPGDESGHGAEEFLDTENLCQPIQLPASIVSGIREGKIHTVTMCMNDLFVFSANVNQHPEAFQDDLFFPCKTNKPFNLYDVSLTYLDVKIEGKGDDGYFVSEPYIKTTNNMRSGYDTIYYIPWGKSDGNWKPILYCLGFHNGGLGFPGPGS